MAELDNKNVINCKIDHIREFLKIWMQFMEDNESDMSTVLSVDNCYDWTNDGAE